MKPLHQRDVEDQTASVPHKMRRLVPKSAVLQLGESISLIPGGCATVRVHVSLLQGVSFTEGAPSAWQAQLDGKGNMLN